MHYYFWYLIVSILFGKNKFIKWQQFYFFPQNFSFTKFFFLTDETRLYVRYWIIILNMQTRTVRANLYRSNSNGLIYVWVRAYIYTYCRYRIYYIIYYKRPLHIYLYPHDPFQFTVRNTTTIMFCLHLIDSGGKIQIWHAHSESCFAE